MKNPVVELEGVQKSQRKYHKAVAALVRQRGDVTPQEVIEAARSRTSPLHNYFDWSDRAAAEKYRLCQARTLIGQVKIRWTDARGREVTSRMTVNVHKVNGTDRRVYASVQDVSEDVTLMEQVKDRALTDLRTWLARYAPYRALAQIRKEVQKAIRNFLEG